MGTIRSGVSISTVIRVLERLLIPKENKNEAEHDATLRKVCEKARKHGIKFKFKKLQLKKTEVMYYGTLIGDYGLKPDPAKIKAILEMPDPVDKAGVRRLNGMLSFLSMFIPNKSSQKPTITNTFSLAKKKSIGAPPSLSNNPLVKPL